MRTSSKHPPPSSHPGGGPILCPVPVQGSGYTGVAGRWRWSQIPAPLGCCCLSPGSFLPRRHLPAHAAPTPPACVRPEGSWAGEGVVPGRAVCVCVRVHSAPWPRLADMPCDRARSLARLSAAPGGPLQLQQQGLFWEHALRSSGPRRAHILGLVQPLTPGACGRATHTRDRPSAQLVLTAPGTALGCPERGQLPAELHSLVHPSIPARRAAARCKMTDSLTRALGARASSAAWERPATTGASNAGTVGSRTATGRCPRASWREREMAWLRQRTHTPGSSGTWLPSRQCELLTITATERETRPVTPSPLPSQRGLPARLKGA